MTSTLWMAKVVLLICCVGIFSTSGYMGKLFSIVVFGAVCLGSFVLQQDTAR